MKTDLNELSALYTASLPDRKPAEGQNCPSVEKIIGCALIEIPQKERDEIVAHVANCRGCAAVLRQAYEIAEETDRFAAEVKRLARAEGREAEKVLSLWARLARRPALAVAAGLFALTVISLSVLRFADRSATRGASAAAIVLVSPAKSVPAGTDVLFKWRPVPHAGQCVVEVFDEALQPVWRSDKITGSQLLLPTAISQRLIPGRPYYWRVTWTAEGRPEAKSNLTEFSVGK